MRIIQLCLLASCLLLFSCKQDVNQEIMSLENVFVRLEGPVFEGPNTAQGTVSNQLKAFIDAKGIHADKIQSAKLHSFTLSMKDSGNFDAFSSIRIQFVSDLTDMIEVATINNIPKGSSTLNFKISAVQEHVLDILSQEKFTIVADALATSEIDNNINMLANLEFKINY